MPLVPFHRKALIFLRCFFIGVDLVSMLYLQSSGHFSYVICYFANQINQQIFASNCVTITLVFVAITFVKKNDFELWWNFANGFIGSFQYKTTLFVLVDFKDKAVSQPSYLYNGKPYTGEKCFFILNQTPASYTLTVQLCPTDNTVISGYPRLFFLPV